MATVHSRLDLQGVHVLVVEDHDDTREMMCELISSFGASVCGARDGREALAEVAQRKPHLIFCDLVMPEMDGFDLLESLRADVSLCRVPVIAVTGLSTEGALLRSWEAGFSGHLVKPIGYQTLASELERAFWAHAQRRPLAH